MAGGIHVVAHLHRVVIVEPLSLPRPAPLLGGGRLVETVGISGSRAPRLLCPARPPLAARPRVARGGVGGGGSHRTRPERHGRRQRGRGCLGMGEHGHVSSCCLAGGCGFLVGHAHHEGLEVEYLDGCSSWEGVGLQGEAALLAAAGGLGGEGHDGVEGDGRQGGRGLRLPRDVQLVASYRYRTLVVKGQLGRQIGEDGVAHPDGRGADILEPESAAALRTAPRRLAVPPDHHMTAVKPSVVSQVDIDPHALLCPRGTPQHHRRLPHVVVPALLGTHHPQDTRTLTQHLVAIAAAAAAARSPAGITTAIGGLTPLLPTNRRQRAIGTHIGRLAAALAEHAAALVPR
mmetsp:Transcript_9557/g.27542  ORF Transcript_9557/g.27542 Transcript_9557/m.27542 type:complete len:346 (-) Transcript_9557:273-1310(-)